MKNRIYQKLTKWAFDVGMWLVDWSYTTRQIHDLPYIDIEDDPILDRDYIPPLPR